MVARKLSYHFPFLRGYKEINSVHTEFPIRHETGNEYRYGFQGQEKDDEITSVEGSHLDFGSGIYDSKVGRWLSVDMFSDVYTGISDYVIVGNNPLVRVDIDGNIWVDPEGRPIVTNTGNTVKSSVPTNIKTGMTLKEGEYYSDIVHNLSPSQIVIIKETIKNIANKRRNGN